MASVTMGVDLGQRRDYSAIVVDHRGDDDTHRLRHIERPRLGTPYPKIIKRVIQIRERLEKRTGYTPSIFLDATGVGRPVVDEFQRKGITVNPVTITAGESITEERVDGLTEIHVGKLALISRLDVLLSAGRIEWDGSTKGGKLLTSELHRFQVKVSQSGTLQLEAERAAHDDLVIALALAVFRQPRASGLHTIEWSDIDREGFRPWPQ